MLKSKSNKINLMILTACLATSTAFAAPIDKTEYLKTQNQISKDYSASKAACKPLTQYAKDVCIEQAKGKEKVARAEVTSRYTGASKDAKNIHIVKADTTFSLAKELCNDKAVNTKDLCIAQAKATHTEAIRAAEMTTEVMDSSHDRSKAAKEKCDAFFGETKDKCVANAKSQYGQ